MSPERVGSAAPESSLLRRGNAQRGPFFCFARTHRLDLVIGGEKVLGSAQRRVKRAVLQHGSLILGRNFPQQPAAEVGKAAARSFQLGEIVGWVRKAVAAGLGLVTAEGGLTVAEQTQMAELRAKYAGAEWNNQR